MAKIIGYGVIIQSTSPFTGPYLHMDDVCKDTLDEALDEAFALRKDSPVFGIFCMDGEGNFRTVYNTKQLQDYFDSRERGEMTDGEKDYQRVIDRHNARHNTTL